jgi:KDO2-lipid IV(A) lauroyltransferase
MPSPAPNFLHRFGDFWVNLILTGIIRGVLALPYHIRVPMTGWIVSRIIAPLAGYNKRVRNNLAYVWPDLPESEVARLCRAVPDNAGRTMIEIYSGAEFTRRIADVTPKGPGLAALDQAHADGRPIILVSGHFGNYDAFRSAIHQRGHTVGALYRDMNNAQFNDHYVKAMNSIAQPMFVRGRRGLAEMVKFLRGGNTVALLSDQYYGQGKVITFFGKPTPAATSAAEMALKYDALLLPIYGIRQPDGLSFEVIVEDAVPHTDAVTMMQHLSDSLEARVRAHPEQWLWIHKRWKPEMAEQDARRHLPKSE